MANVQCVTAYDAPGDQADPLAVPAREGAEGGGVLHHALGPEAIRSGTLDNLSAAGYTGKYELILEPPGYTIDSKVPYKSGARKEIQKRGYKIIANVGDQQSDLKGGYSERHIQAAEPRST